jgi:hypothetical protein
MRLQAIVALLGLGFAAYFTVAAQRVEQSFTLSLSTSQLTMRSGSELRVHAVLTNSTDHDIELVGDVGIAWQGTDYVINVIDEYGDPAPDTALVLRWKGKVKEKDFYVDKNGLPHGHIYIQGGSNFGYTLKPGESHASDLTLTKYFDLTVPGKYTLQIIRTVPPQLGSGVVKSNKLVITVTD